MTRAMPILLDTGAVLGAAARLLFEASRLLVAASPLLLEASRSFGARLVWTFAARVIGPIER